MNAVAHALIQMTVGGGQAQVLTRGLHDVKGVGVTHICVRASLEGKTADGKASDEFLCG